MKHKTKNRIVRSRKENTEDRSLRRFLHFDTVPDRVLFGTVVGLTLFGLLMIASAGVIYGDQRFGDHYYFLKRQIVGVAIGMCALLTLQYIDYHLFRKWSFFIFCGTIVLLIIAILPGIGVEAYGATRWISVGPFSFQPAEAVKLAMILYVAAWCSSKGRAKIADFYEGFVPFLVILGGVSFLILNQPDVGTTGMIVIIASSIFFVAGANVKHLLVLGVGGLAGLILLIKVSAYRTARFLTFLNPDADPQGTGYQIKQALIAIGSGGFFGLGLGHSRQKALYLPEPVGDSIFAIIAEELGFVGCVLVILTFAVIAWRIYLIARDAPDLFGRLIAVGIGVWIVGQAFMNIAAISALMPLTGIPISFISYGGTSMVFMLAAIGILLNISRQRS